MSQRIEIDPELPPLELPRPLLGDLYAHALETLPEECCGLVIGKEGDLYRSAQRCRNDATVFHRRDPERFPRDGRAGFHMNELDYLHAVEMAEADGQRVTVVYHSHVDCGLYFSELDQAYARHDGFPFPDAEHLVISVVEGRVDGLGLFQPGPASRGFVGRRVVHGPP